MLNLGRECLGRLAASESGFGEDISVVKEALGEEAGKLWMASAQTVSDTTLFASSMEAFSSSFCLTTDPLPVLEDPFPTSTDGARHNEFWLGGRVLLGTGGGGPAAGLAGEPFRITLPVEEEEEAGLPFPVTDGWRLGSGGGGPLPGREGRGGASCC